MVVNNSISKHKKKLSVSKKKLKRKSVNVIKNLLNEVISTNKKTTQAIEHTRNQTDHLQILSTKAAELQSFQTTSDYSNINMNLDVQVDSSKPKFLDVCFKYKIFNL